MIDKTSSSLEYYKILTVKLNHYINVIVNRIKGQLNVNSCLQSIELNQSENKPILIVTCIV